MKPDGVGVAQLALTVGSFGSTLLTVCVLLYFAVLLRRVDANAENAIGRCPCNASMCRENTSSSSDMDARHGVLFVRS